VGSQFKPIDLKAADFLEEKLPAHTCDYLEALEVGVLFQKLHKLLNTKYNTK
jgi:hypothetical protein